MNPTDSDNAESGKVDKTDETGESESFSEMVRRMQADLLVLRRELTRRADEDVLGPTAFAYAQLAHANMLQASANLELVDISYAQALAAMRGYR